MKIKLTINQFEYLKDHLQKEKEALMEACQYEITDKSIKLKVENDIADGIRDWAIERQQKIGFDINYNTTSEGKILEELIDLFLI